MGERLSSDAHGTAIKNTRTLLGCNKDLESTHFRVKRHLLINSVGVAQSRSPTAVKSNPFGIL
jgi:hypothetical protein